MDGRGGERPVWFFGDLDDPWVAGAADALPTTTVRVACPDELPDPIDVGANRPAAVVVHRAVLTRPDADRLRALRESASAPDRLILVVGPHARYADLERWGDLFDAVVPEATARETVARHALGVDPVPAVPGAKPRITVVSGNGALRQTLTEACEAAGYPTLAARDWADAPAAGPAVWDVPVLEPGWPETLERRAVEAPVAVLLGFADRATVAEARARGAVACLELPFDLADLAAALARLGGVTVVDPPHAVPPPPASRKRPRPARDRTKGR